MNGWDFYKEHEVTLHTYPLRIRQMWSLYGKRDGETCKHCKHLVRRVQGTSWLKCELTKQTHGTATDWRSGWEACGRFEKEEANGN